MDIEKLIERTNNHLQSLAAYSDPELAHTLEDAATALSTLQAENEKLRKELEWKDMVIELAQRKEREAKAELEQVKRCIEIVENQRDAAIYDMTALMAGQCCDLCAVEHCSDRRKTVMCTAFKWRGPQKED